jgi:putative MATE family efflux protein
MGAGPEVMPEIIRYMHIWYLVIGVQIIPQLAQAVVRASGDARTPSMISSVMCLIIIGLDPLLIYGWGPVPAFGIQGAAIANGIARFFALIAMLSVLHFRLHALAPISLSWPRLRHSWGRLLHVGLPSMSAQVAAPISAALLTKIVALSGLVAVAAYGVASRIEMLAAIYLWGVAGALTAFVGQNVGAGRMDRVQTAIGLAVKFCVGAGICLCLVTMIVGTEVVAKFSDNPEVQALAVYYLRIVTLGYALTGFVMVASQTLNAMHRPLPAAAINLARTVVVTIPFAWAGTSSGRSTASSSAWRSPVRSAARLPGARWPASWPRSRGCMQHRFTPTLKYR